VRVIEGRLYFFAGWGCRGKEVDSRQMKVERKERDE
jgi:hypothetical protein